MGKDRLVNLLIETAELLTEDAASDLKKELKGELKSKVDKTNEEVKLFYKGKMDRGRAKQFYNDLKKALIDLRKRAGNMPEEGEEEHRKQYLLASIPISLATLILLLAINKIDYPRLVKTFMNTGHAFNLGKLFGAISKSDFRPDKVNFNKVSIMGKIDTQLLKLKHTYNKYYVKEK